MALADGSLMAPILVTRFGHGCSGMTRSINIRSLEVRTWSGPLGYRWSSG